MRDRLMAETKAALKAQNKPRLSALRLISAALQERDIAAKAAIPDQEIPALLQKMIKQRRELLAIYEKAGRKEQAAAGGRRDRRHRGVPAQADERGRGQGGHRRRHQGDRRREPQGDGQGDGRAQGALRRPHGLRQGERAGEGAAEVAVTLPGHLG